MLFYRNSVGFTQQAADFFQKHKYLICKSFLPPEISHRWRQKALALSAGCASSVEKQARDGAGLLRYSVVTGQVIKARWPELFAAYSGSEWKGWIKAITGESEIFVSPHLESAININVLAKVGDVYRWHFDAVAYTLLLYLSDSNPEDGGALELFPTQRQESEKILIRGEKAVYVPRAGDAVLMDGTSCYHRVAPILRSHIRISVPMVLPRTSSHLRPSALDNYLYKEAA